MKNGKLALLPEETVERLRASKQRNDAANKVEEEAKQAKRERLAAEDRKRAKAAAREWVLPLDDYRLLKAVASVHPHSHHRYGLLFSVTKIVDDAFSPFENDDSKFWIALIGVGRPSDNFLRAFIEGAGDLLKQIEAAA